MINRALGFICLKLVIVYNIDNIFVIFTRNFELL